MGNLVLDATASLPTIPHGPLSGQISMSLEEYLETTVCLSVLVKVAKPGIGLVGLLSPRFANLCKILPTLEI